MAEFAKNEILFSDTMGVCRVADVLNLYYNGFNIFTLLANWIELICHNFPFAFFSQVFFIQPFVRWVFGRLFAKDIIARNKNISVERPKDET